MKLRYILDANQIGNGLENSVVELPDICGGVSYQLGTAKVIDFISHVDFDNPATLYKASMNESGAVSVLIDLPVGLEHQHRFTGW